jgi:hypothetical protein
MLGLIGLLPVAALAQSVAPTDLLKEFVLWSTSGWSAPSE